MTSLLADVVRREPLAAIDGRSGSLLERVVLGDGQALVVKHVRDGGDWIMRASHDHGRAAELWSSGVLARVPEVVDHAVLGAEQTADGWVVIMRDVSAALVPDDARLSRGDRRRVLEAAPARPRPLRAPPAAGAVPARRPLQLPLPGHSPPRGRRRRRGPGPDRPRLGAGRRGRPGPRRRGGGGPPS